MMLKRLEKETSRSLLAFLLLLGFLQRRTQGAMSIPRGQAKKSGYQMMAYGMGSTGISRDPHGQVGGGSFFPQIFGPSISSHIAHDPETGEMREMKNLNLKHKDFELTASSDVQVKKEKSGNFRTTKSQTTRKMRLEPKKEAPGIMALENKPASAKLVTIDEFLRDHNGNQQEILPFMQFLQKVKSELGEINIITSYDEDLLRKYFNQYRLTNPGGENSFNKAPLIHDIDSKADSVYGIHNADQKSKMAGPIITEVDDDGNEITTLNADSAKTREVEDSNSESFSKIPGAKTHGPRIEELDGDGKYVPLPNPKESAETNINFREFKAIMQQRFKHSPRQINQFTKWIEQKYDGAAGIPKINDEMKGDKEFWFSLYTEWLVKYSKRHYLNNIAKNADEKEFDAANRLAAEYESLNFDEIAVVLGSSRTEANYFKKYMKDERMKNSIKTEVLNIKQVQPYFEEWKKNPKSMKYMIHKFWHLIQNSWDAILENFQTLGSRIKNLFSKN